ncbi:hypothetical protein [Aliiglaciecola aliphaticivorans]
MSESINFDESLYFEQIGRTGLNMDINMVFRHQFYFTHRKEGILYLASFSARKGLVDLAKLDTVQQCLEPEGVEPKISQVIENDRFIYFKSEFDNHQTCINRFDKQSNDIKMYSDEQMGLHHDIEIYAANDKGPLIQGNLLKNNLNRNHNYYNIFQVDFDSNAVTPLLAQTLFFSKSIQLVKSDNDYLYLFVTYECDYRETCDRKSFFRVDVSSFSRETVGGRLNFADRRSWSEMEWPLWNSLFIEQGNLYLMAALPHPGLYKTNPEMKYFKSLQLQNLNRHTEYSGINEIHAIGNGWLVRSDQSRSPTELFDAVRYFVITLDGQKHQITLPYGLGSDQVWFSGTDTAYISTSSDNLFSVNLIDFSSFSIDLDNIDTVHNVIDGKIYGRDRDNLVIMDIATGEAFEFENIPNTQFFSCTDQIYSTYSDGIYDQLFQISENQVEIVIDEEQQAKIYSDTSETGKLVVIYANDIKLFDCHSQSLTTVYTTPLDEQVEYRPINYRTVFYNPFDQNTYGIWLNSLYKISMHNGDFQWVYRRDPADDYSISLSFSYIPIFAQNEVYLRSPPLNDLYKVEGQQLHLVFNSVLEDQRTEFSDIKTSSDGKYLYGSYSESKLDGIFLNYEEPFIFDTETDTMHKLDLVSGVLKSVNRSRLFEESNGLIAYPKAGIDKSNELGVIDIACLLEQYCINSVLNRPPIVSQGEEFFYETGDLINIPFRASDPDLDSLSFELINNPDWMSIDNNGLIHGFIPDSAVEKFDNVEVVVSDGQIQMTSTPITFTINPRNRTPLINAANIPQIVLEHGENTELSLFPYVEDVDADSLTIVLNSNISGVEIDNNGTLLINNPSAGNHAIEFSVSDSISESVKGTVSLIVKEELSTNNPAPNPTPVTPNESGSGGGTFGSFYWLLVLLILGLRKQVI